MADAHTVFAIAVTSGWAWRTVRWAWTAAMQRRHIKGLVAAAKIAAPGTTIISTNAAGTVTVRTASHEHGEQ